ncbi:MAG: hypothetical protein P0Y56_09120 [Candidatus Andeanibacterium colombiense]|uniref:Uncharacterized protein n=1 Tax=Candidatus Andeanibacterium colombiense TaxID=3121345 RepID=A0AAJ5X450_9SPHN|nr:MAG: hypothetical protein P0Y56_09120 [Sphingomonadaceae bacterium]
METTEKIVEAYVRYVKGWATIPNLRCEGQHEIDLIAIDPVSFERYHIETSVSGSQSYSRLTDKAFDPELLKQRVSKAGQRRTLGYFIERKFGLPKVKTELAKYGFVEGEYHNVIVTWDWTAEAQAMATENDVNLWSFQEIMREIAGTLRHRRSYFTDDTLRTINLFVRALAAVESKEDQVVSLAPAKLGAGTPPNAADAYWVYRNWVHHRARLHSATCGYCNDGAGAQGVTGSVTGEWKRFATRAEGEAYLLSTGYADAGVCGTCG